jgi:hypothetical protein
MRLGVAHHLGWAVVVSANANHEVVDRRRIELVEPGLPVAPIHHEGGAHALHRSSEPPGDKSLASLVADVRASATRSASRGLDELYEALPEPIQSISLRSWPQEFPEDVSEKRRIPYESQADSIMYRQVLSDAARARGWTIHLYDHKNVEKEAGNRLGRRAHQVLHGPKETLGPPWSKDHRIALAAIVVLG